MELSYTGKISAQDVLLKTSAASFDPELPADWHTSEQNLLIFGDNLSALQRLRQTLAGKVRLIYIDPPYATGGTFKISEDRAATISSSKLDKIAYSDELKGAEFLEFLRQRMILLRELLSDDGAIYLHIDYKIGHYVKIVMDEVFGIENFRNDITRVKCNPKNFQRKAFGNIKDLVLFYSKTASPLWNEPIVPLTEEEGSRLFKKSDSAGRKYTTIPLHAPGESNGNTGKEWKGMLPPKGRHWRTDPEILSKWDADGLIEWSKNGVPRKRIYLDQKSGKKMQDIWTFKDPAYPSYPTEKNLDLIKFIVSASSNEGDIVLDCFAGSGSTLEAASSLSRRWIGIDQSPHAIEVTKKRLSAALGPLFWESKVKFLKCK